jgi:hypothetical protein
VTRTAWTDDELFRVVESAQKELSEEPLQNGSDLRFVRANRMGLAAVEAAARRELNARWRRRWKVRA